MTKAKPFLAVLSLLLLAAPVAQAGGFDLTAPLEKRLRQGVERARAADTPAKKRLILSETFRDMTHALDRTKKIPGLSSESEQAIEDLQADIQEQHDRLNGLNGFAPVPNADLNNFINNAPTAIDIGNGQITIGVVTALLIVILIILLA